MKNLTITVNEDLAKWARIYAARHDTSISRLVSDILNKLMNEEEGYEGKMRRFLSRSPRRLKASEDTYPSREDLHER